MANTEVVQIWDQAVKSYEAAAGVKLDYLPITSHVDDIVMALQVQASRFEAFRHKNSRADRIRKVMKRGLYSVEQTSKILTAALSSNFAPVSGIFAAVGFLVQTANKVSADYDKITEFFEDVDTYLKQLELLEKFIGGSPPLQTAVARVLASVLNFCGVFTKHIQMKRRLKLFRTIASGPDESLIEARQKFQQASKNEEDVLLRMSVGLLTLNKDEHVKTQAAVDKLDIGSKHLQLNTAGIDQATKSMQALLENQQLDAKREKLMNNLSQLTFYAKQQDILAQHKDGTCTWITNQGDFQKWISSGTGNVLWCSGKPGTGKTVITSFLINHTHQRTRNKNVAIAYVYCDYKDSKTHSATRLLSSIARQFAEQTKGLPPAAVNFCEKYAEYGPATASATEWMDLIETICVAFDTSYVFVDALDECPNYERDILTDLLAKLSSSVSIFVTSHPNLGLESIFVGARQIEITADQSDIALYLELEIPKHSILNRNIARDHALKDEIIDAIQKGANGMFLLVSAQLHYLGGQTSVEDVRNALNTLPNKISDYYMLVFQRLETQVDSMQIMARKAISYVHCAVRPLTADELLQAIATRSGDEDLNRSATRDLQTLFDVCLRLLYFNKTTKTVSLVHGTLNQFLLEQPHNLLPKLDVHFSQLCLTSLTFRPFRSGPSLNLSDFEQKSQLYAFWTYACHNWMYHVSKCQIDPLVRTPLFEFLNDELALAAYVQAVYVVPLKAKDWHNRYPRNFTKLHVSARCGLHETFVLLISPTVVNNNDSMGSTALHLATEFGHLAVVRSALENGASINASNTAGETALALAARYGHAAIVDLLLSHGANADIQDNRGWTPLDWSILVGNVKIFQRILTSLGGHKMDDDKGRRVLFLAAEEGHVEILQKLLDAGIDIDTRDAQGSTALDWAVPAGKFATAKILLRNGADIQSKDEYGNTALHWAINNLELTTLLLDSGAQIDAMNNKEQTALSWAAQDGALEVVDHLVRQGAVIDVRDLEGFRPLHRAVMRGREEMVILLLRLGAEAAGQHDGFWSPLRIALIKRDDNIVQILLSKIPDAQSISLSMQRCLEDQDTYNFFNTCVESKAEASTVLTGIRAAIQENQIARVKLMLELGANVNEHDTGGWTALIMACWSGSLATMQLLIEKGADINSAGFDERTALHWAAATGDNVAVQFLVENSACVDAHAFGQSPAMLAAKNGEMSVLKYLITQGADPTQADYHQRTLLHWVAKHGDTAMLQMLVAQGADLHATDRWGRTVLMWALEADGGFLNDFQRLAMTEVICQMGADVKTEAQYGITALHLAAMGGSLPVMKYLLDSNANLEAAARWRKINDTWGYGLDAQDLKGTIFERIVTTLLEVDDETPTTDHVEAANMCGLTAQGLAAKVGMLAVKHLLENYH